MARLTTEIRDDVCTIALDDGKANALSPDMQAEIQAALDQAEKDAKAVVITGRPGRFSAGFDLSVMSSGGPDAAAGMVIGGAQLYLRFLEFPIPIVVGCTGHAIAAGAIALMTADYRLGVKGDFKIGMNETQIGMALPNFALEFARERLSKRYFQRSLVQAEMWDPEGAVDAGYFDRVVEPDQLAAEAFAEGVRLAALPQPAFKVSKRRANRALVERVRGPLEEDVRGMMGG